MTYEEFAAAVRACGLEPKLCTNGHWQILGGRKNRIVNFWPYARGGSKIYVNKMPGSFRGSLNDAIEEAGPNMKDVKEMIAPWEQEKPERVGLIRWLWRLIW